MTRADLLAGAAGGIMAAAAGFGPTATSPPPAKAATCPAIVDTSGFGATDCNVLLTINSNGTVTTTFPQAAPYDGSDDQYVGILNNTRQTLDHLFISGPANPQFGGVFGGMDSDGICETIRFSSTGFTCGAGVTAGPGVAGKTTSELDYTPDGVTLTATTTNSGFADFVGGLTAGQLGFFSLEEPASPGGLTIRTPEPASLALVGAGLAALGLLRRRHKT